MKILLIEDELDLCDLIAEILIDKYYSVVKCNDGEEGLYRAINEEYDAIILDVMLPGLNGWEILDRVRNNGKNVPILMLTALGDVEFRVKGLNKGADDYLPKPFDMKELIARVDALIRRASKNALQNSLLVCEDLKLDMFDKTVSRDGEIIDLTKKEFQILEYLMVNCGKVITKEELEEHLWLEDEQCWSDVLRTHIKNLRKKIDGGRNLKLIKTIRGIGYAIGN